MFNFVNIFIVVIFFLVLYNKIFNKKGTYNTYYFYKKKEIPVKNSKGDSKGDSKGEVECRRVLEKIFNKKFDKDRPDFLKNNVTGGKYNLELDCYNKELMLAIEYQGIQHYKYTKFFHKSYEHFMNQCYRDEIKRMLCKKNNIRLIEVPYYIKIKDIERYIINEL